MALTLKSRRREERARALDRTSRRCEVLAQVINELKARGANDILIAVVDGLKGFPEATITSVFPQTIVQTCIVHLIRNTLAFVSWKDRKAILNQGDLPRGEHRHGAHPPRAV